MYVFSFPDVAEGIREGKLVDWKVKEGDVVGKDQALCDIETDKSTLEIPSPVAGKIAKHIVLSRAEMSKDDRFSIYHYRLNPSSANFSIFRVVYND